MTHCSFTTCSSGRRSRLTWDLPPGARAGDFAMRKAPVGYIATVGLAAILIMGAGYWGGEMMLGH